MIFSGGLGGSLAHGEDEDGLHGIGRIERIPSPERTAKSRTWRPPTPHPSQDSEKKGRQEAKVRKNLRRNMIEALAGGFDFLSMGDAWKMPSGPPPKSVEKSEQKQPISKGASKTSPRRRSGVDAKKAALAVAQAAAPAE